VKYIGSKQRIFKKILPIILKDRVKNQVYVEPFLGGANSMQYVSGNRIAGESNQYIVEMWQALLSGWKPLRINKKEYCEIRKNPKNFSPKLVGWVGIACSYSGKWFGGFAGKVKTLKGYRNYQEEAFKNLEKQLPLLKGVNIFHSDYKKLYIPDKSIIYCDPPYNGTLKYKDDFDSEVFWAWCREKTICGHKVYISEYKAPNDFICIWNQEVKSSLSANGKAGCSKKSIEKLWVYKR